MNKLILIIPLVLLLVSCDPPPNTSSVKDEGLLYSSRLKTVTIDGCEYYIYDRSLTHKGNCKNHNK